MDAVQNLLQNAKDSQGPFKNRAVAESWLATLTGGGSNSGPSTIDTANPKPTPPPATNPGTNPAGTPPKPVTPPGGADN